MERALMPDYGAEQFYQFLIPEDVFQPAGRRRESASRPTLQQTEIPGQWDLRMPARLDDRQAVIAHQPSF